MIFDLETNGLKGSSVLSCCGLKVLTWIDNKRNRQFHEAAWLLRYYYPVEPYQKRAICINGLTREKIKKMRDDADYPAYFKDDRQDISAFFSGIDLYIAHNIRFDASFMPFPITPCFCTMTSLTDFCALPWNSTRRSCKWPQLQEVAQILNLEYNPENLHSADGDVRITFEIFKRISAVQAFKKQIDKLLS